LSKQTDSEKVQEALVTAYGDLWAHYHSLVRAIGMAGFINDGRLAVDVQIVMEEQGSQLAQEGRRRLESLLAHKD
jgi:CTP synthase (UTP-ammonia lyase)